MVGRGRGAMWEGSCPVPRSGEEKPAVLPSAAVSPDNNKTTHDVTPIHRTYCKHVCRERRTQKDWN